MVSIELIQFLLCAPVDQVLPKDLGGLLTAIVLITMAVTPLLGQMAEVASETFASTTVRPEVRELLVEEGQVADNSIVVCGYGEVGKVLVNKLGAAIDYDADGEEGEENRTIHVTFLDSKGRVVKNDIEINAAREAAEGVRLACRLVDTHPEELTSTRFAQECHSLFANDDTVTIEEIVGDELKENVRMDVI